MGPAESLSWGEKIETSYNSKLANIFGRAFLPEEKIRATAFQICSVGMVTKTSNKKWAILRPQSFCQHIPLYILITNFVVHKELIRGITPPDYSK